MTPRIVLALALAAAASAATTLYVSPEGRAGAPGTLEQPLPSPAAARDAIRARRAKAAAEPVTVILRGGTYRLAEPLVLGPEDSSVTWEAYPGERPILSGARVITGWTKGTGSIWTTPSAVPVRQLFINGRRAQRARTPNQGFYRIDGPSSQDKPFLLRFRGNDIPKAWEGRGAEAIVLLAWSELRMPIVKVDEAAHTATLTGDPRPSNKEDHARYWIENAPDGLDAAGEFQYNSASGTLRYRPVAGEDPSRDEVLSPALIHLVRLEGQPGQGRFVRNVVFRGLDFRHADWSMGPQGYADTQAANEAAAAFEATGAEAVTIERCSFSQMGGYAVWFGRGSKNNRVLATEIYDMGGGGIKLGETVMRQPEAERNEGNTVADSDIHDLGAVYPAAVGVWIAQSSRNTISHNHVHDLYYTAISAGWTWGYTPNQSKGNIIEYNHLHHIGNGMLSDMGAIYTLGEQPGTIIRNNLIHDVSSFTYGGWGIYPDEGSSDMLIENNIVYRTKSAGFHQHYGRENLVRNNIFAFGREFQLMRTRVEPHVSFTFEGNIVYFNQGKLLGSNWTGGQFRMNRNIYWDARGSTVQFAGKTFAEWRAGDQDTQSAVADPLFVNAPAYDFTLRPNSPALKMGFRPIDMSRVGPRVRPGV
ncbi:MAG TPA: right-handed parallel beta-helix repeat-containing protein [Bryobacteraceae bacterium]|nr:right-handed parallel beta-helix repeat-containing protein [Bryobacteraceae bacterium]